jgi:hypothetical protein
MKWLKAVILVALLDGCAKNAMVADDIAGARNACARGASHAEMTLRGTIDRYLGVRRGPSGSHEGFIVNGLRVEDNIDITGFIPLRYGDKVTLQGQYECNDGVIHWTHRDPRGRHPSGYITVNGRTYR